MEKLKQWLSGADYITKVDMQAGFHLMPMALGNENFTAFRTKFGLYEYMLMPFWLTNAPATLPGEINRMIWPFLGIELVINTKIDIDKCEGLVDLAYIDDILIATKGSIGKHQKQVSKVFQLLMDNNMCIEIEKCIFDAKEVPFLGLIVSGQGLKMDPE